jgi:uncharacterized membrane protein YhaH (DUF805 family)
LIGCGGRGSAVGGVSAREERHCWIMTNRPKSVTRENVVGLGTGSGAGRTQFPPRDQLPAGVTVEKLPVLGTSWYERRAGYWVRRVWLFLLMALVVTLTSLLVGGFLIGIKDSSRAGFTGALIVEVVWSLAIIVYGLVRTARHWDDLDPPRPLSRRQRSAAAGGSVLGVLARVGLGLAQFVLVIGSVVFFGLYVMLLIYALLPEYPPEHKARLRLARQLAPHQSAAA